MTTQGTIIWIYKSLFNRNKILCTYSIKCPRTRREQLSYWRVQDISDSDNRLDENQIDDWSLNTSLLSLPEVTDLPMDYSFKGYQEYCMKHGLKALDIQEEIDAYFGLTRLIKRWVLYYNVHLIPMLSLRQSF